MAWRGADDFALFNPKITYPLPVLSTGSQPEKNILSLLADTLNWSKPNVYKSCLPKALSKSNTSLIWTQLWHARIKPQTIHPTTTVSRHMCFHMPSDNLFQLRMARSKPATSSVGSSVWKPDWWQIVVLVVLCHTCKCANAPEWICPKHLLWGRFSLSVSPQHDLYTKDIEQQLPW